MLVSSFNLSQSFNYAHYLLQKTVQIRDQLFLSSSPGRFPQRFTFVRRPPRFSHLNRRRMGMNSHVLLQIVILGELHGALVTLVLFDPMVALLMVSTQAGTAEPRATT
jgi:hypothetical protein